MKHIISALLAELTAGRRVVLCTVLKSSGSAPRGAGASMLVFTNKAFTGTVGGGALERFALLRAEELLREGRSEFRQYRLNLDQSENIGMVCGGEVLLGFFCLLPEKPEALSALKELEAALYSPADAWLQMEYRADGTAELRVLGCPDVHSLGERPPQSPVLLERGGSVVFSEPVPKQYMVYIFGGGHVGRALVPALSSVGFPVTVFDERPELAVQERYPMAERVILGKYDNILSAVQIHPEDYIVVLTPGHKADHQVLRQALKTDATYIGCIGSRKKVAFVNGLLKDEGFSDADLARIHSPIGLPIGAQTPEEIAVSITAELILHRHSK